LWFSNAEKVDGRRRGGNRERCGGGDFRFAVDPIVSVPARIAVALVPLPESPVPVCDTPVLIRGDLVAVVSNVMPMRGAYRQLGRALVAVAVAAGQPNGPMVAVNDGGEAHSTSSGADEGSNGGRCCAPWCR
jgi:hypothetical protein